MIADGEEEGPERIALRAALGRHEGVARAAPRLCVEEKEAALLAIPQRDGRDELREPPPQARKDGLARDAVEAVALVVRGDRVAGVAPQMLLQQLNRHLGSASESHADLQGDVARLDARLRLLRRHAELAVLGGAEADLAHAVADRASHVGRAAGEEVAHVGAAMLHEHAVGEAADRGGNADGTGAGEVAVVVSLLDAEEVEVAPNLCGRLVHLAAVDGGDDVEEHFPRVRPAVVQEL